MVPHLKQGFLTTRWYFQAREPGIIDDMCTAHRKDPHSICRKEGKGAPFLWSEAAQSKFEERLAKLFRAHIAHVRQCVPPTRLLGVQLRDPKFVEQVGQFIGAPQGKIRAAESTASVKLNTRFPSSS